MGLPHPAAAACVCVCVCKRLTDWLIDWFSGKRDHYFHILKDISGPIKRSQIRTQAPWEQEYCLFQSLMCFYHLAQCLAHSRPLINNCWSNEPKDKPDWPQGSVWKINLTSFKDPPARGAVGSALNSANASSCPCHKFLFTLPSWKLQSW